MSHSLVYVKGKSLFNSRQQMMTMTTGHGEMTSHNIFALRLYSTSWSQNSGPAVYPHKDPGGVMRVCPSNLHVLCVLEISCLGECGVLGTNNPCGTKNPCRTKVRAVSAFSAKSQVHCQWVLGSDRLVPGHRLCL